MQSTGTQNLILQTELYVHQNCVNITIFPYIYCIYFLLYGALKKLQPQSDYSKFT